MNKKYITTIFCGDTHGEWNQLQHKLSGYRVDNALIIHVGDVGVGFKSKRKEMENLKHFNNFLRKNGNTMLCIRGNHDNPEYFNGDCCFSNLSLLPDYTNMEINNEEFLFVGGAISIDRLVRKPKVSWWVEEEMILDKSLIKKCDILVTHTAPSWIGPNDKNGILWYTQKDANLWEECIEERKKIDRLIELSQAKKHFCGHFHMNEIATNGDCESRILDIVELYEYRK